jgi:oligoendopeptidase F
MLKYMIAEAENDDEKLHLLNNMVELIRGSVYTQVMYSEFEETIATSKEMKN